MSNKMTEGLLTGLAVIGLLVIIALVCSFPLKWTWNYVMPYIFHLPQITAPQAFCLYFIGGALFKSSASHKKD